MSDFNHSYHLRPAEYLRIKAKPTESDRICLSFEIGTHIYGHLAQTDSTVEFFMPEDFGVNLPQVLRKVANDLEALLPEEVEQS